MEEESSWDQQPFAGIGNISAAEALGSCADAYSGKRRPATTIAVVPLRNLYITNTGKGLLIPRMSSSSITAYPSCKRLDGIRFRQQSAAGQYGTARPELADHRGQQRLGFKRQQGINPTSQFIGTTDNQALRSG